MPGLHAGDCDWTPATVARLRRFYDLKASDGTEGLSLAAIGLLLGVSKDAVASKVHRLDLPARGPSCPRPRGRPRLHPPPVEPAPLRPKTHAGQPLPAGTGTLPPLASELEDA